MAGIKDYSSTAGNNSSVGGISIAEGMLPSNINNAFRAITADIREFYNDSQWIVYGDGDGAHTFAYASGTSFTVNGANVTAIYETNRRVKAVGSSIGTIFGTISSSSFSTNTTVNVTWDSGTLASESIVVYIAALSVTNNSIPPNVLIPADNSITSAKIVNGTIVADDIASNAIITTKILDANVTTAKIADDAITAAKIADAVLITAAEHAAHTPDEVTLLTTAGSDARYFRQDSSETIASGDTWSAGNTHIATTAAIDARIIDLVDDVGGFVPVANETSFPNANPDVNNGTGTIVSVTTLGSSHTANSSGVISISNGTVGNTTVILNGCGNGATLAAGFGILVETTSTLNTYTFVRLIPKATEVTTVAGIASAITGVNNISSAIATANSNSANINTVAGISGNVTTVAGANSNIGTVATDLGGSNNIGTVAGAITNVNNVGGAITNVNNVGGSIGSVNTVATNLASVNNFAEQYRISSSAPTTSLNTGDLYFDTTANELKVYKSSGWAAAGSTVNGTSARFTYTISGTPTTVTGSDANGNTLAYDAGFCDVYLNGVRLSAADITITSGTSIVFASALANGDLVDIVAYGTFNVASIAASNIDSGTLNSARLPTVPTTKGGTGLTSIGTAGQALVVNAGANGLEFAAASSAEVYGFEKYYNASTLVKTVTVVSVGGSNKYFIDGVQQDTLDLYEGNTYVFNYPSAHPFKFSTTSNGTHASGSEYTTGVTHNSSTQVTIVVAIGAPTLYYYCSSHSGMGGTANTPIPANNAVRYITTNKGQDNITESQYANFADVLFSASGFVFSVNSNGNLISTI
mgnify:CR=1 FL=1